MTPEQIRERIKLIQSNRPPPGYTLAQRVRCKKDAAGRIHELRRELRIAQGRPAYLPRGRQGKGKAKPCGDSPA